MSIISVEAAKERFIDEFPWADWIDLESPIWSVVAPRVMATGRGEFIRMEADVVYRKGDPEEAVYRVEVATGEHDLEGVERGVLVSSDDEFVELDSTQAHGLIALAVIDSLYAMGVEKEGGQARFESCMGVLRDEDKLIVRR